MAATRVPPPPYPATFLEGAFVAPAWQVFISALYTAIYGDGYDKVDAARATAMAAVPQTTQVVAGGGLQGGAGALAGNVGISLYRVATTVARLPAAANAEGDWAYALDGRLPGQSATNGTGVPCFWSGSWIAVTSGVTVTA